MALFRRYSTLLLLILLLGASSGFMLYTEKSLRKHSHPTKGIDAYFKNTQYKRYAEDGHLSLALKSPYITIQKNKHSLIAIQPQLLLPKPNQASWTITADNLRMNTQKNILYFNGHVVLNQAGTSPKNSTTMKTSELTVYPKLKATTDKKITILKGDGSFIQGVGARINFKDDSLTLLSQTHAVLTPEGL